LVEGSLLKLLDVIPETKKYAYMPSKLTKTFYGFVGLKNLGCICYMNAMLQQFYMTPQFRHAILMADDKIEPNIVTSEKWGAVDDNSLHQL
jgi:ubiquitin carboxyl-terminal hydrolase 34